MQFILPIILIAISGGLFLTWIDPTYSEIRVLQAERERYDETIEKTAEIREFRQQVQARYNNISEENLIRLERLLPDHIDNIQLILDIDNVAAQNGMSIQDIRIEGNESQAEADTINSIETGATELVGSIGFRFSVVTTYDNFKRFFDDLSNSLRVVDITSLGISAIQDENDFYRFDVGIKTYWLK